MEKFVKENLESGRIRPSQSHFASPFFFRPKPGTSQLQGIQDYHKLNKIIVKDYRSSAPYWRGWGLPSGSQKWIYAGASTT
jgi:hypothetical protein